MTEKLTYAKFHNSSYFRNTVRVKISEGDGIQQLRNAHKIMVGTS